MAMTESHSLVRVKDKVEHMDRLLVLAIQSDVVLISLLDLRSSLRTVFSWVGFFVWIVIGYLRLTLTGNAFNDLRSTNLFPSVGMKKLPPVHLKTNFGQEPFVFDIDGMVKVCAVCITHSEAVKLIPISKRDSMFYQRLTKHPRLVCSRRWTNRHYCKS